MLGQHLLRPVCLGIWDDVVDEDGDLVASLPDLSPSARFYPTEQIATSSSEFFEAVTDSTDVD